VFLVQICGKTEGTACQKRHLELAARLKNFSAGAVPDGLPNLFSSGRHGSAPFWLIERPRVPFPCECARAHGPWSGRQPLIPVFADRRFIGRTGWDTP